MKTLLKGLQQLEEKDLIDEVLVPLINKLHPGRIEYTHSPIESGRDLVSFGKDKLDRTDILCIQVKADKVTYGAQFQGIVVNPSVTAKKEGVTLEDGTKIFPHEVWFITSAPFSEQNRHQVADTLKELTRENIKFIAGEELSFLVMKNLQDIATRICKYASKEIVELISELSKHSNGIAFEMDSSTNINDFYVTASFSPYLQNKRLMSTNKDVVKDCIKYYDTNVYNFLLDSREASKRKLKDIILERETSRIESSLFQQKCNVKFDIEIELFYQRNSGEKDIILGESDIEKYLPTIKDENIFVRIKHKSFIGQHYRDLLKKVISNIRKCPKTLTKNADVIIATCYSIHSLDTFITQTSKNFTESVKYQSSEELSGEFLVKIKIPKPEYLINLSDLILIEGQPGCGKTTLLKKMAVSLLEKCKKIKYINCCDIKVSYINKDLTEIVNDFAIGKLHNEYKNNESILILDGLDEAPFDLTAIILKGKDLFSSVVLSSRTAYSAKIRNNCFNIALSQFTTQERNEFFEKILKNDAHKINNANHLFKTYPDIDNHTKLPIIATLTAALINNGLTPTTRSEIYNLRLELLLSKWDRCRGVSRVEIDDPKAKIRFLKKLAYRMHSFKTRNRFISELDLRETYEESLGDWGYQNTFKNFTNDLVKGSGILIEAATKEYTFGHLSFQEHLAGEYLAENTPVSIILTLLGDDWWKEPLNFWASSKGSITELINKVYENPDYLGFSKQLIEMCKCAPYTSAGIIDSLEEFSALNDI